MKLYDILKLSPPKPLTDEDIKNAYKKLAIKYHPDRGGDAEKFKELVKAYEILSDKERREIYDKFGEEGLIIYGDVEKQQQDREKQRKKCELIVININITLEQFYTGGRMKIVVPMNKGTERTEKADEEFELIIHNRIGDKKSIFFRGRGNEHPDFDRGDVIFNLVEELHPLFERFGEKSLILKQKINAIDFICGAKLKIRHLDGRAIEVNVAPLEKELTIAGEGFVRNEGDLIVKFDVIYPKKVDGSVNRENIRRILESYFNY